MNGTGTVVVFGTSGFEAEILGVTPPNMTRPDIETSHLGTTKFDTFEPGLVVNGGEVELRIAYDPGTVPPIRAAVESISITCSDDGATVIAFPGYCKAFAAGEIQKDQRAEATVTIKVAGDVTIDGAVIGGND